MTDKIKLNDTKISKHLADKDFGSLFRLLTDENFSVTELLIFYRRKKEILNDKSFWTSQLPLFHLKAIVESDFKITFLQSYFSSDLNCNDELNAHLVSVPKSDFIKFVKLWEVFNKPNFYKSLKAVSETDTEFERVFKELSIIIKAQQKIKDQASADEKLLLQFSFGEIALAFTLFYYGFKQNSQTLANKKWQTSIEMNLVDELDNIIRLLKEKENMSFQFFQEAKSQFPNQLIERMIERTIQRNQIKLYLSGYADFQSVILIAPLKTNSNYRAFKINDAKSEPEELYFSGINLSKSKPISKTDITSCIKFWDFYNLPTKFKNQQENTLIDIHKVFKLLKCYSVEVPSDRISVFEYDKLINSISEDFKWDTDEVKSILSFLTFDIYSFEYPTKWIERPFIKSENQVLWIGIFLKDRRWDTVILNRLKCEPEKNFKTEDGKYFKKVIAQSFERKIEELLQSNSFKTISSLPFKSSNGQTGDFDVLAFKDKHLIVCEAKTGTRSDEFDHAAKTEAVRLEGCAADQLEKAIHNIKENWTDIKSKLGITETISIDDIKIVPLIVTDNFEGDLRLYKNTILKTSLLELEVNLKNKKKELLETYILMSHFSNRYNSDFINSISQHNWDLWKGQKECSVENLIQNIEQNAIWKELETVWKFEDISISLDY